MDGCDAVLVIDDQDDIREVVRLSLEVKRGLRVLTAATGAEGVAIAREEQPGAILLDWAMPTMDGPTTMDALQADARTRAIPVLALTARPQEIRRPEALCGVIAKPFDPEHLPSDLERALGRTLGRAER